MDVIRCKNGHFFDGDLYGACPHCGESAMPSGESAPMKEEKKGFWGRGRKEKDTALNHMTNTSAGIQNEAYDNGSDTTSAMKFSSSNESQTPPLKKTPTLDFWQTTPTSQSEELAHMEETKAETIENEAVNPTIHEVDKIETPKVDNNVQEVSSLREAVRNASASNEGKTMSYFSSAVGPSATQIQTRRASEPVVGWLVCIGGCYFGECFNIYAGKNSIGRSEENRIIIADDNSISRVKHALLVYEPKKRNFYIQPGDSSGLTYLNDEYITESHKLQTRDIIELGESKFMFMPLCCEEFSWEDHMPKGE